VSDEIWYKANYEASEGALKLTLQRLELTKAKLADAIKALRMNQQYWACMAEFEDAAICGEHGQFASDATDKVLEQWRAKNGGAE